MENQKKLNLNLADNISGLRELMHHFEIKTKIFERFSRGKGFEFDGFRPYNSQDDASSIDWKASIRSNKLLVKQYLEEAPMKIFFVVDASEHMILGSGEKLKCEYSAELVLSLMHLLTLYNNKMGLVMFNDRVVEYLPARRGINHFYAIQDSLSNPSLYRGSSKIDIALDFVLDNLDSSVSAVLVFSDFMTLHRKNVRQIDLLSGKYETLFFIVKDIIDKQLPDISGEFIVEDTLTGQQILLDPKIARAQYAKNASEQDNIVRSIFKKAGIDHIELITNKTFVPKVTEFIKGRVRSY